MRVMVLFIPLYSHIKFVWLDVVKVYSENFVKPGLSDNGCAQPDVNKHNPIVNFGMKFMLLLIK